VRKKDNLLYLAGLDYTLKESKSSGSFFQQASMEYDEAIGNDEYSNIATFLATKD